MKDIILALKETNLPIYLAGHLNPDDDSIGSCLSLGFWLQNLGKEVYFLLEEKDREFSNHTINIPIVDKVSHEKYAFCAMDLNETFRLGVFEDFYKSAYLKINIDHHQGNKTNADYTLSEELSSTCEIVYEIIALDKKELLSNVNLCQSLYLGILTDSKGLTKRLSNRTLTIAQNLINVGLDYENLIRKTIHYRTLYQFQALSTLINEIKSEKDYLYCIIDRKRKEYASLTHNDIVKVLSEEIRKIEGVDIMLVLIKDNDKVTGKVISNISKNAHLIAQMLGGGGHKGEAGFTTTKSVDEILNSVNDFLKK